MSIQREKDINAYVVRCDEEKCNFEDIFELEDFKSFSEVIDEMKNSGWGFRNDGGLWLHKCPACCAAESA